MSFRMKRVSAVMIGLAASIVVAATAFASDDPLFHSTDPLAARDEYGKLHQGPWLNSADLEPRYTWRPLYYLQSCSALVTQPAYVGALEVALRRNGYYCGEIDGNFTPAVSDAIARLQKNYSMRVTGTLTVPVRRALFLP
jgi:Putative peptidoglycan binding domain